MNLDKISKVLSSVGGLILFSTIIAKECVFVNDPGERAILFNKLSGIKTTIKGEGINFKLPYIEDVIKYDIRLSPFNYYTFTATKDLQNVELRIRILYKPLEKYLPKIHLDYTKDYANKLLPSIGNEVLKQVIANYDVDQLLKQRELVSNEIKAKMVARAKDYHIIFDEVMIYQINLSPEYIKSIERKQVEQQEVERLKYVVMMNEEEKIADIIKAEGESESAKLIAEATKNYGEGYIEMQKMNATKEIIKNLAQNPNVGFIPENNNILLSMNHN